jgi:ribosomal protein S1
MQANQHGDLSTMPAANLKSGRVQTMIEGNDPQGQNNNNPEEVEDFNQNEMEALLAASANPINIKRGDVVEGVIVRIDQDEILVDIGLKSEGVLSTKELPPSGYGSFNELHLNDKVLVYVIQPETSEGHAVLSLSRGPTPNASGASQKNNTRTANFSRLKSSIITKVA